MLSTSRLALAPVLGIAVHLDAWVIAVAVFLWSVASDLADGWLARRFQAVSAFGGFLDHAADAATVVAALLALGLKGVVPTWLFALIALAFVQYAGSSRFWTGHFIQGSQLGRANGIGYFILVGIPVTQNAFSIEAVSSATIYWSGWVLAATTLASMGQRMLAIRPPLE